MKKIRLLIISMITFLCGCSDNNKQAGLRPDGSVFTKNFVQAYNISSDITLGSPADGYIAIMFDGKEIKNTDSGVKYEYDILAEKHKDLSYNDYLPRNSTRAIGKEYTAIDIICNKKFDESHDAGTLLNDIVKICANSFQKFIKSGYDDSFESPALPGEFAVLDFYNGKGYYPVFKFLNEVTKEDLILIEPTVYLFFTSEPIAGEYEFTININSDNGTISKKINILFE